MTDKELKKLSRLQLLELLLEQSKENEQLRQDNENYRQENENLQNRAPVASANVDPAMLSSFSEVAEKIDSSLSETRKATQNYINRLAMLAEYAERSMSAKSGSYPAPTPKKVKASSLSVTDEAVLPEVEEASVSSEISVKPLAKSRPVKKLEAAKEEADTEKLNAPVKEQNVNQPQFVPMGGYPVMSAPVFQPMPVYYPVPTPPPAPVVPKEAKRSAEIRSENGINVRQLSKMRKEEPVAANEDTELVSALADFYFENPLMLEMLPENIRKQIINRFKR